MSFLDQKKRKSPHLPLTSLNILKKQYESKQVQRENYDTKQSSISSQEICLVYLIKKAKEIVSGCNSDQSSDYFPDLNSPSLHSQQSNDLELAISLQAAAFHFSMQQFVQARNLLSICRNSASPKGNPLQRLLYYYTEALQERILTEMGESEEVILQEEDKTGKTSFEETLSNLQNITVDMQESLPFCRINQFTAIQAILENVGSSRKLHLVDLGIKNGSQWPILMQALATRREYPIESLKITAIGSSKGMIEEIGNNLSSFAESLNIPFAFRIVVSDLKNLEINFFELASDELLAVYSELRLATLLAWPHHLESLLKTLKKLKPRVMVTMEVDSNTNAPGFMDRFNASLSISAAMFDCLDHCIKQESQSRAIIEGVFLREGIRYLVTSKGEESIHRQESITFWRTLFKRFGIYEIALSDEALYQATLMAKSNPLWSSCTLKRNGKGMTVGWKETPIHFLAVWKF
ncbi:OLC1v1020151C1 [Oldenlandia corymbosa var. corymbosa]|uniref:OLC1v1020151C1 n=1 Tax=Oldenlandia corymbosa var. corymbosa TaxID=529605 RepID=A0AAV1EFV7_OLDCO|nr:OLC1v1020151C1 [Oldenlandia corymbosa var. corymbosa]